MARSYVQVNDRLWREIKRQIPLIEGAEVTVGVQADAGASEDGTPIATYAFYNEMGTRGGGWGGPIPARPFMRDTFDQQKSKWGRTADLALSAVLRGTSTLQRGLSVLGTMAQKDIQDAIVSGNWAPNSPVTVAMKGSDTPLVDTGALRQSIRYEVNI